MIPSGTLTYLHDEAKKTFVLSLIGVGQADPDYEAILARLPPFEDGTLSIDDDVVYTAYSPDDSAHAALILENHGFDSKVEFESVTTMDPCTDTDLDCDDESYDVGTTVTVRFNDPDSVAGDHDSIEMSFDNRDPPGETYFESHTYDAADKRATYSYGPSAAAVSGLTADTGTTRMTFQEDSSRSEIRGLLFTMRTESSSASELYRMQINGVADDEGGYADSNWGSERTTLMVSGGFALLNWMSMNDSVKSVRIFATPSGESCEDLDSSTDAIGYLLITGIYSNVVDPQDVYPIMYSEDISILGNPANYEICARWDATPYTDDSGTYWGPALVTLSSLLDEDLNPQSVDIVESDPLVSIGEFNERFDEQGWIVYSAYKTCAPTADPLADECYDLIFDWGQEYVSGDLYRDWFDDAFGDGSSLATQVILNGTPPTGAVAIYFTLDGTAMDDSGSAQIGIAWPEYFTDPDSGEWTLSGDWSVDYCGLPEQAETVDAYVQNCGFTEDTQEYRCTYEAVAEVGLTVQED